MFDSDYFDSEKEVVVVVKLEHPVEGQERDDIKEEVRAHIPNDYLI